MVHLTKRMSSITYILAVLLAVQACSVLGAHISSRITGGEDAVAGKYPYQVSIEYKIPPIPINKPVCGGAILTESWVVTSASCLSLIPKVAKILVKAGKHELRNDDQWVQAVDVSLRLVNAGYKANSKKAIKPNDIALLKLKSPLVLNKRVMPITLPLPNEITEGSALLTGWGSVSKNVIPELPDVLQVANVSILSVWSCNDALSSLTDNEKLAENQICTGPLDRDISACSGDLGDPLVQILPEKSVLKGITSWSPNPCGQSGSPTIHTQVSSFVDWITQTIEEN